MLLSHLCTRKPESWTSVSEVPGRKPGFVNLFIHKGKDIERAHPRPQKRQAGRTAEELDLIAGNVYRGWALFVF